MEDKILNMGCLFKCSACPTVRFKPIEISAHKVNVEKEPALTTSTQLIVETPGNCPYSPIPPNPSGMTCIPLTQIVGHWEKTSKHTIGGKNLLIQSSEFVCDMCKAKGGNGKITVCANGIVKTYQDSYSPRVLINSGILEGKKVVDSRTKNKSNISEPIEDKKKSKIKDEEQKTKELKEVDEEKSIETPIEDLYCPYDATKDKCKNCKYVKTDDTHMLSARNPGSSDDPGKILRNNYIEEYVLLENTRRGYKKKFQTYEEEVNMFDLIGCGNQAHHILSTKDVYEQDKLKFVLKLANFYDYKVNEAYNCILLPAYNAKSGRNKTDLHVSFGNSSDYDKRTTKYKSMRQSGRQWHGGGHGIDFENEHNISCYATEVTDLVYKYTKGMTKKHCRIEDKYYENDRKEFVERIHAALDEVREKLIAFSNNPQNSLPFYVSKDAYEYAFSVANIRVLVFAKSEKRIKVYKYNFVRRRGNTEPDERGVKEFDLETTLSVRRMIAFCEQIDIAYFDEYNGKVRLPFSVKNVIDVNMYGMDVKTFFKNNISQVEAEIFDFESSDENVSERRKQEIKEGRNDVF